MLRSDSHNDSPHTFSRVSPATERSRERHYQTKEVIYREGDPVGGACLIRKGLVKLLSYLPNGRARIVRLHTHGQWIGLEGLVGQLHEHTAVAVNDLEVEVVPIDILKRLDRADPDAFRQLLCQWHGDLTLADRWISEFSTGDIPSRVARMVEYLTKLENGLPGGMVELLTVQEMAEMLGVTPESVSRILAGFKRRDILRRQANPPREIYQVDSERLRYEARL